MICYMKVKSYESNLHEPNTKAWSDHTWHLIIPGMIRSYLAHDDTWHDQIIPGTWWVLLNEGRGSVFICMCIRLYGCVCCSWKLKQSWEVWQTQTADWSHTYVCTLIPVWFLDPFVFLELVNLDTSNLIHKLLLISTSLSMKN